MSDDQRPFSTEGLSLERLNTLCGFVEAGSLARLAGGSHPRASLFSRQLKELETYFGVALAKRAGRMSVPTEAAGRLAALAREHMNALLEFRETARELPPRLTLAASHSVLAWWVMPRLAAIEKALPRGARLVLLDLRTREIAAALEARLADLGLLRADAVPETMVRAQVTRFGYALFVRTALVRGRGVAELLRDLPLAVSVGGQFRRDLEAAARASGFALNIALECSSFALVAAAVHGGGYAAVLPEIATAAFDERRVSRFALPFRAEPIRSLVAAWPRHGASRWVRPIKDVLVP